MEVIKVVRKKAVKMKSRIHFSHQENKNSKRLKRINFFSPDVASILDHTRVSDRNATYILAATAKFFGHNPSALALNKESIRQACRNHRVTFEAKIQKSFSADASTGPLTVHWDGKLLPALTGKEKVDRLAVIVSRNDTMKLLGVPLLIRGTGEAQAEAVFKLISDWNLVQRI